MYALIVVIAVLGGTVTPVGVGSQVVGKFRKSRSVQSGCKSTQRRGRYLRSESLKRSLLVLHLHRRGMNSSI